MTDVQDLIMTRLQLCNAEITGVKRSYKFAPAQPIDANDLPATYHLMGPMLDKAPISDAGSAIVKRRYAIRLLIAPFNQGVEYDSHGVQAINDALPFIALFENYFLNHPRLNTDGVNQTAQSDLTLSAQAELGLSENVAFQDSGPTVKQGPGGGLYWLIDFNLDIAARVYPTSAGLS